jgi:Flp pilus assembly protein TadG
MHLAPLNVWSFIQRHCFTNGNPWRNLGSKVGQNLVELVLILPIFLVMLFSIYEFGRYWQTTETVKLAALDGVAVAAQSQNIAQGNTRLITRLAQAGITPTGVTGVTATPDNAGYVATVNTNYTPLFAGLSIPTLAGSISIIPAAVPINYKEIKSVSVL